MKTLTQLLRDGNEQAAEAPTAEQISRLARALANTGYGPDLARAQKQDTETWDAVAAVLDKQAAGGAR